MKIILAVALLTICLAACKQNSIQNRSDVILANGQMPAIAKDWNNNLHLIFGRGDSLMYLSSNDNGYTFSAPALIKVIPHVYTYATRGPQIAATGNGLVITACTTDGNIYSFRREGGGGWQEAQRINDRDTVCKEGLMALSADGNQLFAVWLDGRDKKDGVTLYGAKSADGGNTWSQNIPVYQSPDSSICECCKPSVVMQKNKVAVMFRNWLHGNRDLYLLQSTDCGNTFGAAEKLGKGSWQLNGCPMDGGNLVMNSDGNIETVWRREATVYAAPPNALEQKIGGGRNCTLETVNDTNVYAWVENGSIVVLKPDGKKEGVGIGNLPVLKALGDAHVICVWEKDKQIHISVLPL